MNLIEEMMEQFCFVDKTRTADGEGGFITQWVDGVEFQAVATMDTTMEAKIAESNGVTSVYTITTPRSVKLEYSDVIRRLSDGKIFRVTSDAGDKVSPAVSSLDIAQVSAEKWELTS